MQLSDDESDEEEEAPVAKKKKRKTVAKVKAAVKDKVVTKKAAAATTKAAKKGILTKRGPSTPTTDPEESADEALVENKTSDYTSETGSNFGGGDWRSFCAVDW